MLLFYKFVLPRNINISLDIFRKSVFEIGTICDIKYGTDLMNSGDIWSRDDLNKGGEILNVS